jgi:predicted DNA-binding transcriptional regulator AlpA
MKTVFDEKVEKLKSIKQSLDDQAASILLEPLLTTSDLERLLKVDRRTITRLVKRGELPAPLKLGGSNRWRPEAIAAALDRLGPRIGRRIEPAAGDQTDASGNAQSRSEVGGGLAAEERVDAELPAATAPDNSPLAAGGPGSHSARQGDHQVPA